MRELTHDQKTALELMIDQCGLARMVSGLAGICDEKAGHVRVSYSDNATAAAWERAGKSLQRCADSAPVQSVSS